MAENDCIFRSPPERLRRLLDSSLADSGLRGIPTGVVFAQLMDRLPHDKKPSWYLGTADFLRLIDVAEQYVADRIPSFPSSPHQETFSGIRALMNNLTLETGWQNYAESFSPYVKTALPFVVHAVETSGPIATIPRTSLDDIITSLDSVREQVKSSDLPPLLKQQLDNALRELRLAVEKFDLYGMEGITTAAALVVSVVFVQQDAAKASKPTIDAVLGVVVKIEDVILKAVAIGALAAPVIHGFLEATSK